MIIEVVDRCPWFEKFPPDPNCGQDKVYLRQRFQVNPINDPKRWEVGSTVAQAVGMLALGCKNVTIIKK